MTATDYAARAAEAEAAARKARAAAIEHAHADWKQAVDDQPSRDAQLLADYPKVNRQLMEEERAARRAFEEALVASPFGAAWTEARAAHYRRTEVTIDARNAAARIGGRAPTEIGYRDPRLLEDVVAALDRAAQLAAMDEREPITTPGFDPVLVAQLVHLDGCPATRIEAVTGGIACVGCGARRVEKAPPEPLPPRDSEQFRKLWKWNPSVIVEQLTEEERGDPLRNPKHPNASAEPSAFIGGRPTR
jgi:hypothetical protein